MMNTIKTYSELIKIPSYIERYYYLKLGGIVGRDTFGHERYLNQILYNSHEWRRFRDNIIVRDKGCDMAFPGFEVYNKIMVHHIDPITISDVLNRHPKIFDPENVVSVSFNTHQAIHYGSEDLLIHDPIVRRPGDTCPWR